MNVEKLQDAVKRQMPEKRWKHTLGVVRSAIELAEIHHGDTRKAERAALLHDYCKSWPVEEQRNIIIEQHLPPELLSYGKALWHAPVGAYVVKRDHGLEDEEILNAIRYHTSGREQMTLLDKIVCLADYIEPGRYFPGVDHIRELAKHSLDHALVAGFDSTISFLLKKGQKVFPLTIHARNALLDEIEKQETEDIR